MHVRYGHTRVTRVTMGSRGVRVTRGTTGIRINRGCRVIIGRRVLGLLGVS